MNDILLIGEDALCCELGKKMIRAALPSWVIFGEPINKRGVTRLLPELKRYAACAINVRPVLCLADTDRNCPVEMREKWLPVACPPNLLFRLAVPEAESWVLADRTAVADFFEVPLKIVPPEPESLQDPKLELLRIAGKSRKKDLRAEMIGTGDRPRPGVGYNVHLTCLVREGWNAVRAESGSSSLRRALARIRLLDAS